MARSVVLTFGRSSSYCCLLPHSSSLRSCTMASVIKLATCRPSLVCWTDVTSRVIKILPHRLSTELVRAHTCEAYNYVGQQLPSTVKNNVPLFAKRSNRGNTKLQANTCARFCMYARKTTYFYLCD